MPSGRCRRRWLSRVVRSRMPVRHRVRTRPRVEVGRWSRPRGAPAPPPSGDGRDEDAAGQSPRRRVTPAGAAVAVRSQMTRCQQNRAGVSVIGAIVGRRMRAGRGGSVGRFREEATAKTVNPVASRRRPAIPATDDRAVMSRETSALSRSRFQAMRLELGRAVVCRRPWSLHVVITDDQSSR
jgi:hypothetical protein